jgi:hypothetical protein
MALKLAGDDRVNPNRLRFCRKKGTKIVQPAGQSLPRAYRRLESFIRCVFLRLFVAKKCLGVGYGGESR